MPQYQCPQCEAILKRAEPIAAGKKVRCPSCEAVFVAKPMKEEAEEKPKKAKPKVETAAAKKPEEPPSPKAFDEDDGPAAYGVVAEEPKEEDPKKKKKDEINYGSLRDKFAKSKKGPAMALTVRPSNALIMWGILVGILAIVAVVYGCWPMIFSERKLSSNEIKNQLVYIIGGIVIFIIAGVICWGAGKLQSLESYIGAWVGCILGIPIGFWGIAMLVKPEVKEGFEEVEEGNIN